MTHTPGPWHVDSTTSHGDYQIRNTKRRICAVRWDDSDHSLDDARIIAAAPALLEALEALVTEHEAPKYGTLEARMKQWDDARAAIALAKGESK